jgi:hypothetical protein
MPFGSGSLAMNDRQDILRDRFGNGRWSVGRRRN